MSVSNESNPHVLNIPIGTLGAAVAATKPGVSLPRKMRIKSAKLINLASLSGNDTNNFQMLLRVVGGNTLITYLNDVASGGLTANVGKVLTLVAAEQTQAKDVDLEVDISKNGSGQAQTDMVLQLEIFSV